MNVTMTSDSVHITVNYILIQLRTDDRGIFYLKKINNIYTEQQLIEDIGNGQRFLFYLALFIFLPLWCTQSETNFGQGWVLAYVGLCY